MYMLGLIYSCIGPFLQTHPNMAFWPPIRVRISLYGNKLRQVEGDSPSPKHGMLVMNSTDNTESAGFFLYCGFSLLMKDPFFYII